MSADATRYGRVAQGFTEMLGRVGDDQWTNSTPCEEWDVRQLVAHTISTQHFVLARLNGGEPAEVDAAGDLPGQWSAATTALLAAVTDPTKAGTHVEGFGGQIPFEELAGGLAASDTVVHTWDLARALHLTAALDVEAVEHCRTYLAPFGDAMRRPGGFAAEVPSSPEDDAQTRFLHFCGRECRGR